MSRGVPNSVVVLTNDRRPCLLASCNGNQRPLMRSQGRGAGPLRARNGVGDELLKQRRQHRVGADIDLAAQSGQQVSAPFPEIANARGQPLRVEAEAQRIDRRYKEKGGGTSLVAAGFAPIFPQRSLEDPPLGQRGAARSPAWTADRLAARGRPSPRSLRGVRRLGRHALKDCARVRYGRSLSPTPRGQWRALG